MGNVTVGEAITLFFGAVMVAAIGYEINRRQKQLREVYDVLDKDTQHVAFQLEDMIQQGKLKPYTEESWG